MLSFSQCYIFELSVANKFIIYIQNIYLLPELTGRAILIGGQTSDTHVTAKLVP